MNVKKFNLSLNKKINSFNKDIEIDSDKSMSIRSFLLSAISQNVSTINNVLESEDVFASINSLKKLGVKIKRIGEKNILSLVKDWVL